MRRFPFLFLVVVNTSIVSYNPKDLLPEWDNDIKTITRIQKGASNTVYRYITQFDHAYIIRQPKKRENPERFKQLIGVMRDCASLQISPMLLLVDEDTQTHSMSYIPYDPWPAYTVNPQPYHATMRQLRRFHERMRSHVLDVKPEQYYPFTSVLHNGEQLSTNPLVPNQFHDALARVKTFARYVKPWLDDHATMCHGDFHKDNVLLEKKYPWIIDFDAMAVGHPYFDVVKFSYMMQPHERAALFNRYLDKKYSTVEENRHFLIMDAMFLMIVTIVRLKAALSESPESLLSKEDAQALLSTTRPLPSFKEISFNDPLPKNKQRAALCALHEFLRKTEPQFNEQH